MGENATAALHRLIEQRKKAATNLHRNSIAVFRPGDEPNHPVLYFNGTNWELTLFLKRTFTLARLAAWLADRNIPADQIAIMDAEGGHELHST